MELISYAIDFVSFLFQNFKNPDKIKAAILFGSVARNEATKESDIDIFIDVVKEDKKIEKEILKVKDEFFDSIKFKRYWKLLGIQNDVNIVVGKLEKWKLRDTMLGNAIILYQKYTPKLEKGKNIIIFNWGNIKPDSKRVMLNKKIFGYNYYGKRYEGMLQTYEGRKIGTNVIAVPAEHLNAFLQLFRKFKVAVKISRVFEYES